MRAYSTSNLDHVLSFLPARMSCRVFKHMCVVCARMRLCVSYDNVRTHAFDGTNTCAHNTQALLVKAITNATANANAILGVEIADTIITFLSIPDVDKEVRVSCSVDVRAAAYHS